MLSNILLIALLRWVPPVVSAFTIQKFVATLVTDSWPQGNLFIRWTSYKNISRHLPLAIVAAEDQKFPFHNGFDFEAISAAYIDNKAGDRIRGGSTISQQVAKNLFLWSGRSYLRKALEAYFTVLIELIWPKERILEVYINIAEMGDGVFGVGAAAPKFFRKKPQQLNMKEAALLAAVLPNPSRYSAKHPSRYVLARQKKILFHMRQLGTNYLRSNGIRR